MHILKARIRNGKFLFRIWNRQTNSYLTGSCSWTREMVISYLQEEKEKGADIDIENIIEKTKSKGTSSFFDPPEDLSGEW